MPGSFANFDQVVEFIFRQLAPRSLLDVGSGAGKYGKLMRKSVPACRRIAIEIEDSYIDRFRLGETYDEVRIGDALGVLKSNLREVHDVVIIGDCIEHMPKSIGTDLLHYLMYRSQYIIVLAPEFIIQHDVDGVNEEAHVSVWSEHDFAWHDRWAWDNCWSINLFVLRGYQKSATNFETLVKAVNAAEIPLLAGYSGRVVRPARLDVRIRYRNDTNEQGKRVIFRPL